MLRQLALRNFRNFEQLDVRIPESGMVIVGENGHGKTNLLEAVSYLSLFRSLRGAKDGDVVRFGAPAFHVRAELAPPARFATVAVGYERSSKRKRALLDAVEQDRLSMAFGALPSVCFSPSDVALVAGGPAERRHFLDIALALSVPGYLPALQKYRSALKQRNAALRVAQRAISRTTQSIESSVAVWEPALAQFGAQLATSRQDWCTNSATMFSELCASIGERSAVSLRYAATDAKVSGTFAAGERSELYQRAFDEQRANELKRGVTLVGPHRDDMQLLLGTHELRTFGSAGQQRSAAIALRMLELESLRRTLGASPLLLLDDPFAELDANRANRILTLLEQRGIEQVLLVVPREMDIPPTFTRLERRTMRNGELVA